MNRHISSDQIDIEIQSGYRPLAIDSGITILPLVELGDREFELLAYILVKQEIADAKCDNFTEISLMQGVSERGRDCVLYNGELVRGLIQCKKYQGRITKPQALREVLKFLLFSLLDSSLMPEPESFEYNLYVSNDLTEPAINLFRSYKVEIEDEINSGTIEKYLSDVIEEYESFSVFQGQVPLEKIIMLLRNITISYSNATDLSSRIYNYDSILSMFFNVKTVVDLASAETLLRNTLEDFGLKLLTDDDLKMLQERIGRTALNNRVNLGTVDFFGFSKEFFKFLKGDKFKELLGSIAQVRTLIGKYQIEFLNSKMHEFILQRVTGGLLSKGKIHTFSVGIAAPYLFKRLIMNVVTNTMPKAMLEKYYPQFTKSRDELVSEIAETLYHASEKIMKGDYSELVGNPSDIAFKKRIFEKMHQGFESIDDARTTFEKDIILIRPVLDEIENEIGALVPEEDTIVIKDTGFFDDKNELARMAKSLKEME